MSTETPTGATPSADELFDVVLYLVNSAPTSLEETPSLAALRMVDAANRLMGILERSTTDPGQLDFLSDARADYEAHYGLVMTDQPAFHAWLPSFVRRCTEEAMRRVGVPPPT